MCVGFYIVRGPRIFADILNRLNPPPPPLRLPGLAGFPCYTERRKTRERMVGILGNCLGGGGGWSKFNRNIKNVQLFHDVIWIHKLFYQMNQNIISRFAWFYMYSSNMSNLQCEKNEHKNISSRSRDSSSVQLFIRECLRLASSQSSFSSGAPLF